MNRPLSVRPTPVIHHQWPSIMAVVSSGVPQGTVLGPLLFLAFTDNLPDEVLFSKVRLFANEFILYRNINFTEGAANLNKPQQWEEICRMQFHPDKCQLLRISNKRGTSSDHNTQSVDMTSSSWIRQNTL